MLTTKCYSVLCNKIITREVKITHSHLMPLQQHLYNGLAHPVDHSIFVWEWTYLPAVE